MHKLSYLVDEKRFAHSFAPVYAEERTFSGTPLIITGAPGGDALVFETLTLLLEPPYVLLYVLHTPRGEAQAGRYESDALHADQLRSFLARFHGYLAGDGRFDLWALSTREKATVVWDHHNQLFAYGPIAQFASRLRALGFHPGELQVPDPHEHHFREEYDGHASEVFTALRWTHFDLEPEDGQ